VFYGWWMVSAGTALQIIIGGLMFQSFSSYAAVLREEFGWSKTALSAAFSMSRVESGLLGPAQGWLIDRFGPAAMIRVGIVIMTAGFLVFSQVHSLWHFYVAFLLIAVGSSLAGFMTLTVAIVNWFERKRARALGLMSAGMAIGGLLVPVVAFSLDAYGFRWTAFGAAIVIMVGGQALATFIRRQPEDHGLSVDGAEPFGAAVRDGGGGQVRSVTGAQDFTAREAMRTRAFWFISLGHASALLVVSAVMVHLVLHINESLGYSLGEAGLVVAMMTGFQIVGQVGGGMAGDYFNKRVIVVACMAGHALGLVLLAFATAFWMIILFAMLHGLAWGTRGPLMQAMRADYFGRTSFGTIMGFSSMIVMLGMTFGPIFAGLMADRTGNYEAGFTVLAGLAALGSVFFILAAPPAPPARVDATREGREGRSEGLGATQEASR
jgi:MFS family permease